MVDKYTTIRYKRLDDLVRFVSMAPTPFLNHAEKGGKHFYFLAIPYSGGLVVCYYATAKKIDGEYVSLNRMSGAVSSTAKPSFDAKSLDMPILEVEHTDFLDVMS